MKKRILLFFVTFAIFASTLSVSAVGAVSTVSVDESDSIALTILHTNDVHGRYSAESGAEVPHDIIAGYYESLKQPVLLLSAGDMTQGVYYVNESKGLAAIDIMNAAKYDAMAVGNHEFDYGWDNTLALQKAANFPFLSQIPELKDYTVIERGGIKVGIFGLTTPYTKYSSSGGFDKNFGLRDELIDHAKKTVAQLRTNEKVDVVVCLSHLGVEEAGTSGTYYGTSYDIRDKVDGIDVIIDGHSHTALADVEQKNGNALIVQTGAEGKSLGEVDFYLQNGKYVPVGRSLGKDDFEGVAPDKDVTAILDKWQATVVDAGSAIVSKLDKEISVDRQFERTQETIMGDLITDAMVAASGADIAIENGGGIRASLSAGDVTVVDINNVLPFTNYIVMAEIKGSVIREALEHSVSVYPEQLGGFLQVSGLEFGFDPDLEANHRVIYVTVDGQPLDNDKTYKVAANDFTAAGGDDFAMLKEAFKNALPIKEQGLSGLADILTWYLNNHKDDISFETQGRIKIIRTTAQPAPDIAVDPVESDSSVENPATGVGAAPHGAIIVIALFSIAVCMRVKNKEKNLIRKIIEIDSDKCNGCGLCAKACHEGAIGIVGGKAKLLRDDYCDGLGNCLPVCPTGAIAFVEREAANYNEAEVKKNMQKQNGGCPGSNAHNIKQVAADTTIQTDDTASELRQWPVQIKLVPVNATYFENADLLISADCAAYARANFHSEFMRGKITLIGCPKLDGVDYSEKLTDIIAGNNIESLTVVRMEVPCCGGIEQAVVTALKNSGKAIPLQIVTLTTDGNVK